MTAINQYISHARERVYMSGVERNRLRIQQTAEVFTPTELVLQILDMLEKKDPTLFVDETRTFLDNSCGDCQFLSEVVIRKMQKSGCTLENALSTIYGVELMLDNVNECKRRLAGPNPTKEIIEILESNIVCANGLLYDYTFEKVIIDTNNQIKLF
jgi:hypothetical protein